MAGNLGEVVPASSKPESLANYLLRLPVGPRRRQARRLLRKPPAHWIGTVRRVPASSQR
jgi:hypothetical protein